MLSKLALWRVSKDAAYGLIVQDALLAVSADLKCIR